LGFVPGGAGGFEPPHPNKFKLTRNDIHHRAFVDFRLNKVLID
jgi:hypothetical protein